MEPNDGVFEGSDGGFQGTRVVSHARIAPLPRPEELQGYEDIVPGAGEKIIQDMLTNSAHRRHVEKVSTWFEASSFAVIAWLSSLLPFALAGVAVWGFVYDHAEIGWVATGLAGATVAPQMIESLGSAIRSLRGDDAKGQ